MCCVPCDHSFNHKNAEKERKRVGMNLFHLCRVFVVVLVIAIVHRRNWCNVFFRYDLHLAWYSKQTLLATDTHTWNHGTHDLQRIARAARIPPLTHYKVKSAPIHTYISPVSVEYKCTSFVRTCCTLCTQALKCKKRLRVGILVSLRTDDSSGNFLAMASCSITRKTDADTVCRLMSESISSCSRSVKTTMYEFLGWYANHDIVFNNWRNIETLNQRAPHLRLLTPGETSVDFTRRRQELRMSHDGQGWYIVSQQRYL